MSDAAGGALPDGQYDAIIVDAELVDAAEDPGPLSLDLAIASGEHRGEIVTVTATGLSVDDPIELLAFPVTLTVAGGEPAVRLDL